MEQTLPTTMAPRIRTTDKLLWGINILFLVALATDLFTPFLIWKTPIPSAVRWFSHAAIAAMIVGSYLRMMTYNRFPSVVWLIAWVSVVGVLVARLHGQGIVPTIWGWWVMFQFPMVGLFAYMQKTWPERFPQLLMNGTLLLLAFQLVVQVGQFATGEPPGDHLAGTFGRFGHLDLVMVILLAFCLALGRFLATGKWGSIVLVLLLGGISSAFGEMKIFFPGVAALGGITGLILVARTKKFWLLIPFGLLLASFLLGFLNLYNAIVPAAERRPLEQFVEDPELLQEYLGRTRRVIIDGRYYYDIGRNDGIIYGWNEISQQPETLLFGFGLGARGESRTLGTAGSTLNEGRFSNTGTSLLVMLQEMGVVGLTLIAGFIVWLVVRLWRDIKRNPDSGANGLRFALILFTLLWPVWLWYSTVWVFRFPMLLYWIAVGYALSEATGYVRHIPLARRKFAPPPPERTMVHGV
jgi:hypothetical protein